MSSLANDDETLTLTFEEAERLYGAIMSGVFDLICELGGDLDDESIKTQYDAINMAAHKIYDFTPPPKR